MEYLDEKMIKAMNQGKAILNGDIYTGINMRGDLLKFREEVLFEERMSIMLPVDFSDMDEKIAKLKYLMEQRPKVIKTNEQASIDFTFNLLDVELSSKQVSSLIDVFYNTIKSVHPSNIFYEKKTEVLEQFSVGWFDFKSHGVDVKIYNIMYCLPIAGKTMHGVFNCPMSEIEVWKPCALEVMRSIKDLTIKPEEEEVDQNEG